ncbi:hypothetical protein BHUM_00804c [Candidatus Burkholderia humilis]|nr:hypothetical protein BHUM_00804c [Candidatus Burkholderia humilis]
MSVDQRARSELAHISRVITELERIVRGAPDALSRSPVMQADYWRRRIDVLIGSSRASEGLRRDFIALRAPRQLAMTSSEETKRLTRLLNRRDIEIELLRAAQHRDLHRPVDTRCIQRALQAIDAIDAQFID